MLDIKKIVRYGLLWALIATMVVPFGMVTAQSTYTVQSSGLFVYAQPDINSTLIAVLSTGATVTIVDDAAAPTNGFTQIRLPTGTTGWAQLSGTTTTTTDPTQPGFTPVSGVVVMAVGNVRIRDMPSLSGTRIGMIAWGELASLLAIDPTGFWYQIDYNGLVGWSSATWFRIVSGDVAGVTTTTTTDPTPTPTATDTTTTPDLVSMGGITAVATGNVRIRETPSLAADRIGLVPWGATVTVLGVTSNGDWLYIDYNGTIGWSASIWYNLSVDGETATINSNGDIVVDGEVVTADTPTDTTTTTTTATGVVTPSNVASGVVVMAVGNVRIRAAPSITGDRLGYIAWGEHADALAITSNGSWLYIDYNGVRGWAATTWFEFVTGSASSLPRY